MFSFERKILDAVNLSKPRFGRRVVSQSMNVVEDMKLSRCAKDSDDGQTAT